MCEARCWEWAWLGTGAEMVENPRWVKHCPAAVLESIDSAVHKVKDIDWKAVNRRNFPLPGSEAFFDDVREELENGSGMVKMRGLEVGNYNQDQLRRIWYGLGAHLGTPLFQNRRGEVMRRSEEHTSELQSLMRNSY